MAVDDHGLEVLKKAGEEVTPGDKSDYYIKVKDINSASGAATETTLLSVLAAVDGLEALITSTNALLTTIQANVDQLEGYLDGVEGLLTTGNTSTASIDTSLDVALSTRASETTLSDIKTLLSTEYISGQIEAPQDKTYTLDLYAIDARTINTLAIKTTTGTCTVALEIDGVSVTGISAVSVSSVETTATATALNSVSIGQTLTMVVSSISSATDLVFTIKYVRG